MLGNTTTSNLVISVPENLTVYYVGLEYDTGSTILDFDYSNVDMDGYLYTWRTWFDTVSTNASLSIPAETNTPTLRVHYATEPDLSGIETSNSLYFVWEAFVLHGQTNLIGNQYLVLEPRP